MSKNDWKCWNMTCWFVWWFGGKLWRWKNRNLDSGQYNDCHQQLWLLILYIQVVLLCGNKKAASVPDTSKLKGNYCIPSYCTSYSLFPNSSLIRVRRGFQVSKYLFLLLNTGGPRALDGRQFAEEKSSIFKCTTCWNMIKQAWPFARTRQELPDRLQDVSDVKKCITHC